MLTGHQRLELRRAGFRIEDDIGSTFVAILDHPTMADAYDWNFNGRPLEVTRRADVPSIQLPFVAIRVRRSRVFGVPGDELRFGWEVLTLATEPDEVGVHYVPQLDGKGREALAALEAIVAEAPACH